MSTEQKENLVIIQPDLNESKEQVEKNPDDALNWYKYGVALGNAGDREQAIKIFSEGIAKHPKEAYLHFGRGRQYSGVKNVEAACQDFTEAIELNPTVWTFWYYRATNLNLRGFFEESIADFKEAANRTNDPNLNAPMAHWIYTTYVADLDDREQAKAALDIYPDHACPPQMDYGYNRCIQLYKEILTPETFIDLDDMKEKCLPRPGRIQLELNTMYFALFAYHLFHQNQEAASEALAKLRDIAIDGAFGYLKGQKYFPKFDI